MSDETEPQERRLPFHHIIAYGFGSLANNFLAAMSGGMMFVLNIAYGMDPRLVGLLTSIPRLTDALTDPLMGYISDKTHTRWGRRRPYIFSGAIVVGLVFMGLWQIPTDVSSTYLFFHFLLISFIFFAAYTVFATPWVALGYELTPDTRERSTVMGVQNFIGQLAYVIAPWTLAFVSWDQFDNMQDGAAVLAIATGVVCALLGIVPALVLRERFSEQAEEKTMAKSVGAAILLQLMAFLSGFAKTLSNFNFLRLGIATFLIFNGFQMVGAFQLYVVTYYVYGGDTEAAGTLMGWFGTLSAVCTFAVIALVTWLSSQIGKRRTFMLCIGISAVGYGLKWFCYSQSMPWLILITAPLIAFGLGSLFTLMGAMIGDVCDVDELKTGERREGMYGSIFWWVVKLGMSLALLIGGFLLNATGFDIALGPNQSPEALLDMRIYDVVVPLWFSLVAMGVMYYYDITEESAIEVRAQLEARRGVL